MRAKEFYAYAAEREQIRLAKAAGKPWPWTKDPILQTYKFTNVRREYDRTTQEFKKIYARHPDAPPELIWLNCAIARYFGSEEYYTAIGWQNDFKPAHLKAVAKERAGQGQKVFTGAYVITNQGISAPKEDVVVDMFIKGVWEARKKLQNMMGLSKGSWESVLDQLSHVQGFGGSGFMGKEVTLDTMFFPNFWPKKRTDHIDGSWPRDYGDWTPIGPGAQRGLMRVFSGESPRVHPELLKKVGLKDLLKLHAAQAGFWKNKGWLAPTDIQFTLCEFDKYERVRLKEGKPRSQYHQRG